MWVGVWAGAGASLCPHVHKEVLPKKNPKDQKEQRTKNEHENKSPYFLGGIHCRRYILGSIRYRQYLLGGIQFWRYLLGGIESWRYPFAGIESWYFWRYLELAVHFGATGKTKIRRYCSALIQYGGIVLAVGGFSFLGGNTFAVGGISKLCR